MTPEQADIALAVSSFAFVDGVYELRALPSPEWPSVLVVMRGEDAYELGAVTGALLRALPDRARHHVGVVASQRLRDIMLPRAERLKMSPLERIAAESRARMREAEQAARPNVPTPDPEEAKSIAAWARAGISLWRISDGRVVALEVAGDPFRVPALTPRAPLPARVRTRPRVLVVASTDALRARVALRARWSLSVIAVASVERAIEALAGASDVRTVVCSEDLALADDGLVARLVTPATHAVERVVTTPLSSPWRRRGGARSPRTATSDRGSPRRTHR